MTAEIAVMNKQGIALAADSAVTVRTQTGPGSQGSKIYVTANKIFALSKRQPVAIMIYNGAQIMGIPWETVIKKYRQHLGDRDFPRLPEYVADFTEFVASNHEFFPEQLQAEAAAAYSAAFYEAHILGAVEAEVEKIIAEGGGPLSEDDVKALFEAQIQTVHGEWSSSERIPGFPPEHEQELTDNFGEVFEENRKAVLKDAPELSPRANEQLVELPVLAYSMVPPYMLSGLTGVVFAGYGTKDIFPSLRELFVDEVILDRLICWPGRESDITRDHQASVIPFAQNEMVARFMTGVDPEYQQLLDQTIAELMHGYTQAIFECLPKDQPSKRARKRIAHARDSMLATYIEGLEQVRSRSYVDSITGTVQSLPLTELAEMAESLVNLTSFKRKVSMEEESVSEPIDVAVISAGDGFIWINRKHYFSPEKNHHFFANYYRGD